jgi:hypothetical protein
VQLAACREELSSVESVTQIFVLALKGGPSAQIVAGEQSFSVVAGPVRCLYKIAQLVV